MHKKSFIFGLGLGLIIISMVFYIANFFENRQLEASLINDQVSDGNIPTSTPETDLVATPTPEPPVSTPTTVTDEGANIITEELSEDEIIKKASELGMVFIDIEEIASYVEEKTGEEIETEGEVEAVEDEVEANEDVGTEVNEETESEVDEEVEVTPEFTGYTEFVKVRIKGGMSAVSIARLLSEHGVVENPNDFINFLVRERVTTTLSAGDMVFPLNAKYQDILNVLRKRVRY